MDEYSDERLDALFHALADATRRAMLARLAEGECSVGDLAAPFRMSLAAASKHIKTLERAGLVRREIRGRHHVCALVPDALAAAEAWLRPYAHSPRTLPEASVQWLSAEGIADLEPQSDDPPA